MYCGKLFTPTRERKYYCSDRCKVLGSTQRRKEWEERTNYKEKDRERKRKARQEHRTAANEERELRERILREEQQREGAENLARYEEERRKRCAAGDPLALMMYHQGKEGNLSEGYLLNYARYMIDTSEALGSISAATINGISVYDPRLVEKVQASVKDGGTLVFENK